jgi:hypothetical protein
MRTSQALLIGFSMVILTLGTGVACQSQAPATPSATQPEYIPTSTIKELMLSVIDPSADVVWLSVTTVVDDKGLLETKPITDEDWTKVRHGAITLMEAANLLMMPGRRVARPGEKSETPGVELEPEEMDVLIAKDRPAWNTRAKALHDVMAQVVQAVDAKDAEKVFELGEQIEHACENCHRQYWYPNEVIPEFPADTPSGSK